MTKLQWAQEIDLNFTDAFASEFNDDTKIFFAKCYNLLGVIRLSNLFCMLTGKIVGMEFSGSTSFILSLLNIENGWLPP